MATIQYSTSSLTNRDYIFLQSIIVIYNSRGNAKWMYNEEDSELLIVGKDADNAIFLTIPDNIKVILSLGTKIHNADCHIIYVDSPLRATNLIEKLKEAEDALQNATKQSIKTNNITSNNSKKLKLLRWPTTEITTQNMAYPILSALLSKRPMDLAELTNISKKPEDICRYFIELIVDAGCAEYITSSTTHSPSLDNTRSNEDISNKRGLLDKIRNRLGLFWN